MLTVICYHRATSPVSGRRGLGRSPILTHVGTNDERQFMNALESRLGIQKARLT